MHYFIFPTKDATIYEDSIHQNTGMDQIIELEKQLIHAEGDVPYNSRILIQFDLDEFSASLATGETSGSDMKYYLNLTTDVAVEIPVTYSVFVYPVGIPPTDAVAASMSADFTVIESGSQYIISTNTDFTYIASSASIADTGSIYYFLSGSTVSESIGSLASKINNSDISGSVSASSTGGTLSLEATVGGVGGNSYTFATGSGLTSENFSGGVDRIFYSSEWQMGNGKRHDIPVTTTGVSWDLRDGVTVAGLTGSAWVNNGGDYFSGSSAEPKEYEATQSFDYQTTDLHVDVTNIVESWLSGSIQNFGFLIKRDDSSEQNIMNQGNLQFFSKETHTIYRPRLEVIWRDYIYSPYITSSISQSFSSSADVDTRITNPILYYTTQSAYTGSGIGIANGYFTQSGDTNTWYSESYSWVTDYIIVQVFLIHLRLLLLIHIQVQVIHGIVIVLMKLLR
jgi:hypothetical protein